MYGFDPYIRPMYGPDDIIGGQAGSIIFLMYFPDELLHHVPLLICDHPELVELAGEGSELTAVQGNSLSKI